jgi:hypothetical protein
LQKFFFAKLKTKCEGTDKILMLTFNISNFELCIKDCNNFFIYIKMSKVGLGTFVTEDHQLASKGLALLDIPSGDIPLIHSKLLTVYPSSF